MQDQLPSTPSSYVKDIFSPLSSFLSKPVIDSSIDKVRPLGRSSSSFPPERRFILYLLPLFIFSSLQDTRQTIVQLVGDQVCSYFCGISSDIVETMRRTEASLKVGQMLIFSFE